MCVQSYVVGVLIETALYGNTNDPAAAVPEVEPQHQSGGALSEDGQQHVSVVPGVRDLSKPTLTYDLPPEVTAESIERHNDGVETV